MSRHRLLGSRWVWLLALAVFLVCCVVETVGAERIVTLPDGTQIVLFDDFTWRYYTPVPYSFDFSSLAPNSLPPFLRPGTQADIAAQTTAVEMYLQGWRYAMPRPKSAQAAWGNTDGRTTWYYGYWYNTLMNQVSKTQP